MSAEQNDHDLESKGTNGVDGAVVTKDESQEQPKKCACVQRGCHSCSRPFRTKYNPLPDSPSWCDNLKYGLLCPPHGKLAKYCFFVLMFFVAWAVLISTTGAQGLPGGNFFSLVVLFFSCVVGGYLVVFVKLPPLLGEYHPQFMYTYVKL